jgi:hypothetical protein
MNYINSDELRSLEFSRIPSAAQRNPEYFASYERGCVRLYYKKLIYIIAIGLQ